MQLYFIRHGQSENNALWERVGSGQGRSADPGLTETGQQQAEHLAAFLGKPGPGAPDGQDMQNLNGFALTHLYTSLMVRAVATGTIVANALGLPLVAWVDLHEGGGIYLNDDETGEAAGLPGKPRSFFETHYPDMLLPPSLDESGWWNRPFESRPERRVRALRALAELLNKHGGQQDRVALVSHGGFYNHWMAVLLNLCDQENLQPSQSAAKALKAENVILSNEPQLWFTMNNAAITRIDFTPDETKICYMNRVDFLPKELVT